MNPPFQAKLSADFYQSLLDTLSPHQAQLEIDADGRSTWSVKIDKGPIVLGAQPFACSGEAMLDMVTELENRTIAFADPEKAKNALKSLKELAQVNVAMTQHNREADGTLKKDKPDHQKALFQVAFWLLILGGLVGSAWLLMPLALSSIA